MEAPTLTTNEINFLIKRNTLANSIFLGTYPANKLPKLPINTCIIVNCCSADKLGIHWVSFFRRNNEIIEFFDSSGVYPGNYLEIKYPDCKLINYSRIRLQSLNSSTCGWFAMYFVWSKAANIPFKEIINSFSPSNLAQNDKKVFALSKKLFKIN